MLDQRQIWLLIFLCNIKTNLKYLKKYLNDMMHIFFVIKIFLLVQIEYTSKKLNISLQVLSVPRICLNVMNCNSLYTLSLSS